MLSRGDEPDSFRGEALRSPFGGSEESFRVALVLDGDDRKEGRRQCLRPLVVRVGPRLDLEQREKSAVAAVAEAPRPLTAINRDELGLLRVTTTKAPEGRALSKAELLKRSSLGVRLRHRGGYGFHICASNDHVERPAASECEPAVRSNMLLEVSGAKTIVAQGRARV